MPATSTWDVDLVWINLSEITVSNDHNLVTGGDGWVGPTSLVAEGCCLSCPVGMAMAMFPASHSKAHDFFFPVPTKCSTSVLGLCSG